MEAPPVVHLEAPMPSESHPSAPSSHSRRSSLTPSARRERPPLRSSPLAGPSYAADSVGNVIQRGSALVEEIAWRRSQLHAGLNDEELARLAAIFDSVSVTPMPSSPLASTSTDALPSSNGGSDASDHSLHPPVRRARPSFISLAPPSPGTTSPGPQSPTSPRATSPTLRARHSSPNMAHTASRPRTAPPAPFPVRDHVTNTPAANWMAAAPTSSFSRGAIHATGVVMPVKASSRSGQRIRRKSMPAKPSRPSSKPSSPTAESRSLATPVGKPEQTQTQPTTLSPRKSTRSLRSLKSISRIFKPEEEQPAHQEPVPPVPALPSPHSLSRASSISAQSSNGGPSTPTASSMPSSPAANRSHLHVLNPSATQSKFSVDESDVVQTDLGVDVGGGGKEVGTGRVRKLWARVMSGVKKRDRA